MRASICILLVLLFGCAPSRPARIQELFAEPAHWVEESQHYEPNAGDFTFEALDFPSVDEGWFVGDRYALHVKREKLEVIFSHPLESSLTGVAFKTAEQGWAGGFRTIGDAVNGVIWEYGHEGWRESDLNQFAWGRWWIDGICTSPDGAVWARARVAESADPRLRAKALLLRLQQDRWQVDVPAPLGADQRWEVSDCCFCRSGSGWFVGRRISPASGAQAFAVRNSSGTWHEAPPLPVSPDSVLRAVSCLPDGGIVALGSEGPHGADRLVVLLNNGGWRRIELPERIGERAIGALAAVSQQEFWLALNSVSESENPRILHWLDGAWIAVPTPELPEGRRGGYVFTDMQFISPDEGWATASDYDGPGLRRGLIFHYKDGVWRIRNWNWHFWDQPGFGLFGE